MLGYLYAKNLGVEKHSQKIKKLLLIHNESIPSLYYLGCIYLNDSNQDPSALSKAATFFAKMIEADFRITEELSRGSNGERVEASYSDEVGNPIELEGCLKLLMDAGKNGNSDAQFSLGLIFLSGWRGFDVDIETATDLISSSANLGHPTAIALMNRRNQSI
jgi:TPR repeat protein